MNQVVACQTQDISLDSKVPSGFQEVDDHRANDTRSHRHEGENAFHVDIGNEAWELETTSHEVASDIGSPKYYYVLDGVLQSF